jgi:flagellar hook-associated protein 1 FlgK
MSLISIGLSGLSASQAALSVTSNNIANAATSGYSRQQTLQVSGPAHNIGSGFIGTGTSLRMCAGSTTPTWTTSCVPRPR